MEKGQFRCDANVSIRLRGSSEFGTRTELKNINSFRFVEEAISAEIERQAELLDEGGEVQQATMAYDPGTGRTQVLRLKEDANDYRYFPDPDLIPLAIAPERIEAVRAELPELPDARRGRLESALGLSSQDAAQLAATRSLADFFEAALALYGNAKALANWVLRDVLQALNERECEVGKTKITPESLSGLIALVDDGRLTVRSARELVPVLIDSGGDPGTLMRERGLEAVSDVAELEAVVDAVIADNAEIAEKVRGGDDKPLNALMGQVMRRTEGKANPGEIRALLAARLRGV